MTWKKLNKTKKRRERREGRNGKTKEKETRVLTALSVGIWSQLPVEINEPMLARCERLLYERSSFFSSPSSSANFSSSLSRKRLIHSARQVTYLFFLFACKRESL